MKMQSMVLLAALAACSCTDDNQILTGVSNDDLLKTQLLGTWQYGDWFRLTFRADNTFSDSAMDRSATDSNQYYTAIRKSGTYAVTDGVLRWMNVHWVFADSTQGFTVIVLDQKMAFANGHLLLSPAYSLTSDDGYGLDLPGAWTMIQWGYEQTPNQPGRSREGSLTNSFFFDRDSNLLQCRFEYFNGSTATYAGSYAYNPPLLDAPVAGVSGVTVRFTPGRMFWFYNIEPFEWTHAGSVGSNGSHGPHDNAATLMRLSPYRDPSGVSGEVMYLPTGVMLCRHAGEAIPGRGSHSIHEVPGIAR